MFPTAALGSALRGAGVVRPTMMLQTMTVLVECSACARADRGLGHRSSAGRHRRGAGDDDLGGFGVRALAHFPTRAKIRRAQSRHDASAAEAMGPHHRHRLAIGGRILPHVCDFRRRLLGDPAFRTARAGGLRRRHADHAVDFPAGDGGGVRGRADCGTEFRRRPRRSRALHLPRRRADLRSA